jgi:hypothetical protein
MAYDETQRRISLDADASVGIRTGVPGMPGSLDPNGGKQFTFVKVTGSHTCGSVSAAGGDAIGVLQNKPQRPGEASSVAISGVTLLLAGTGGLVAGNPVKSDAAGAGIVGTPGTDTILGTCIEAGAAGALAAVLIRI